MKKLILLAILTIIAKPTFAVQTTVIDDAFKDEMFKAALAQVNWNRTSEYIVLNITGNTYTLKSIAGYTYQCIYSGNDVFNLTSARWQRIRPHIKYTPSSTPNCFDLSIYAPAIQDSYNETVCK